MDALNARTKHSAQRFHNVIYSNVLIIILCSLYDRLALYMLHISVLSFSKWFQSYFKQFKTIMQTAHIWSVSKGNNALFIGLKISAKVSYQPILIYLPIYRASLFVIIYACLRKCNFLIAFLFSFIYSFIIVYFFLLYLMQFLCYCPCGLPSLF